jgi:hypothetical protein
MMENETEGFIVEYSVYRVSNVVQGVEDDSWFEYRVELLDGDETLDKWDSRVEAYNGVESQRLTQRKARHTCEEIKEDVEQFGKASNWFNV